MVARRRSLPLPRSSSTFLLALALAGCGGAAGGGGAARPAEPPSASDAEWRALASPRPRPLEGAPGVSLSGLDVVGRATWTSAPVDPTLGVTELMAAALLHRQDVVFVERRRFAAAAEAERRGTARPPGAPAAGVSSGARYLAFATWSNVGSAARLDVRLNDMTTGQAVATWKATTPVDVDPVALARLAVAGTLAALDSLGARPEWEGAAAPASTYTPSGIPPAATAAFFRGLAAEESWRWEWARVGYQGAMAAAPVPFPEAEAALARAARLRNGGTLGVG